MLMVYVMTGYFHSARQWLWREDGASRPACCRQAGLGAPFLLAWPASEYVLQSEATDTRIPVDIAHEARPPRLADSRIESEALLAFLSVPHEKVTIFVSSLPSPGQKFLLKELKFD
jgi:hypothetical protein